MARPDHSSTVFNPDVLACEPVAAQDGSESERDRGADPRLGLGKAGGPGVRLGGAAGGGRTSPTRIARRGGGDRVQR
jgi:hypothetical protein